MEDGGWRMGIGRHASACLASFVDARDGDRAKAGRYVCYRRIRHVSTVNSKKATCRLPGRARVSVSRGAVPVAGSMRADDAFNSILRGTAMADDAGILWRRLDTPGHESASLRPRDSSWLLGGTAVFADGGRPCRLNYRVVCDSAWNTVSARVEGWLGSREIEVHIELETSGRWRLNGLEAPSVEGCVDIDLNFSPSTNLLPVRRLGLEIGEQATVRAAWLRFPTFVLEPLEQVYARTASNRYRYESGGGAFVADLEVDAAGFVTRYAGIWQAEPLA
jgi:uncharacterized protein